MKPFFSVVIPLYNKEKHIVDTIKSVLAQTFQDFEIIIINDGCTDSSYKQVKLINNSKIQLFSTENKGVSHARNLGIKKANGKLIAFLDADDTWFDHHLEDLKKLFERYPNCGLYCKAYTLRHGKRLIKSIYKNIPEQTDWMGIVDDYFESSSINCIAWTSAVAIPKHTFKSIGDFDTSLTMGEDTELWLRIALKHPVSFYHKISAVYNLDTDNRITNLNTNSHSFIDLDKFELLAIKNKSLKTYLDLNRYSIAIQYKLVGNNTKAKEYINKINKNNLNYKQRFLLKLNAIFLSILLNLKNLLRTLNINLSTFK